MRFLFFERFDPHQDVKVVTQQAIGVGVGDGPDVLGVELEEMAVVAIFAEEVLAVVAAVVDVIVGVVFERGFGRGIQLLLPGRREFVWRPDPKGLRLLGCGSSAFRP